LTDVGAEARDRVTARVAREEEEWRVRIPGSVTDLRDALERIVLDTALERSPLAAGLEPPPDGWRSKVRRPEVLPHHPVVTHRGGYPDGS
jgi:hypothetical protein